MGERIGSFRQRLKDREPLAGTFQKTPSPIIAEVLGLSALDVVCLDVEHAPFGRMETDSAIAALRASDMPSLVRVSDDSSTALRNALDSGATGVLVPHVTSAAQAASIVKRCHFGEGGRGYAGSPRAAAYGTKKMPEHIRDCATDTSVIVQIEDLAALDQVSDIAATPGLDALFIGRADLAVAMGESPMAQPVIDNVARICEAARTAGIAVGMFTPDVTEIPRWRDAGASLFLLASDHSFLLQGAAQLVGSIR
ncbi:MAG: aldolase/citrate lyase family protein [Pseudomonadota bacterium]